MKIEKEFDAVRLMRDVRDKMSVDMKDMSYEEKRKYIERRAVVVRQELRSKHERTAT